MFDRLATILLILITLGLVANPHAQEQDHTNSQTRSTAQLTEGAGSISTGLTFAVQPADIRRFDLTLDDVIQRALERNLDIAVERINPQVFDLTIAQQNAFYRPTVGLNLNSSSRTNPSSTQLDGGDVTETDTANLDVSLNQPVKWGGGSLRIGFDNNRQETTNAFSSFNPGYRSSFVSQYTQPLLKGFRTDNNRSQLQVTRINRDISDIDLRQTITNIVADVENAYWELLYAVASVDVQQQALDLAEQLILDNQARVNIGTLAPIDVVQSQAEAAARRQTLAQAQQVLRTSELALKRLIVGGTQDELWYAEINPIDQPQLDQPPIDIAAAVTNALGQRTALSRAQRQQDINQLNVGSLRNSKIDGHAAPEMERLTPSIYRIDGKGGMAPLVHQTARKMIVECARDQGVAITAFVNIFHMAALWPDVEPLAEEGLAALSMTTSRSFVAPAYGSKPFFGTNPMAFAWPRSGRPPMVFDQAISVMARGEVQMAARDGHTLPEAVSYTHLTLPTSDLV